MGTHSTTGCSINTPAVKQYSINPWLGTKTLLYQDAPSQPVQEVHSFAKPGLSWGSLGTATRPRVAQGKSRAWHGAVMEEFQCACRVVMQQGSVFLKHFIRNALGWFCLHAHVPLGQGQPQTAPAGQGRAAWSTGTPDPSADFF